MKSPVERKRPSAPDMSRWLIALSLVLAAGGVAAAPAGQVTHLSGILSVKKTDGSSKILSVKSEVQEGDMLSTESETYARIKFADGAEVVMRPGSQLKVESYAFSQEKPETDNVVLNMLKGGLRAVTGLVGKRNKDRVSFNTATATIGIRGTHFGALMCSNDCGGVPTVSGQPPANGLHVDVASGAVSVTNGSGQVVLNAGQFGYVPSPTAPPVVVPPQQGIQVTMPSSISQNSSKGQGLGKDKGQECSM